MGRSFRNAWLLVSIALAGAAIVLRPAPEWVFAQPQFPSTGSQSAFFETVLDFDAGGQTAHAVSIIRNGDAARLIWFQGSKEAARDVKIMAADVMKNGSGWSANAPSVLFDAPAIEKAMTPAESVWILGNTIQRDPGNADDLLATVVSIGGWSLSGIAAVTLDGSAEVQEAERLSLSPFLNRSYLVRSPVIAFADGDAGVPAYFEMGNARAELFRLNGENRVVAKRRITQGNQAIQPDVTVFDADHAVALMRNFNGGGKMVASWTEDGGNSWTRPKLLDVPNPDAPVAAIALDKFRMLMVHNAVAEHAASLALSMSQDRGRTWKRVALLEDNANMQGSDVRYPAMAWMPDGSILVAYSHGSKAGIRAHVFNVVWLEKQ